MSSNKSTEAQERIGLKPQRRRGQERVAAILEAGAAVIAEKGYDAATMAEIAQRAGAQAGSLYRFFPSKDVLANALIERYRSRIGDIFDAIDAKSEALPAGAFADAMLDLFGDLRSETQTIAALLEGRPERTARRLEFRRELRKRIARTLVRRCPELKKAQADDVAAVLLQNMKSLRALTEEIGNGVRPAALAEFRTMNRHYLVKIFENAGYRS